MTVQSEVDDMLHTRKNRIRGMITLETLMPLSLAISACGGAFWISSVATRLDQAIENLIYLRDQKQKFDMSLNARLDQNQRDISDIKVMAAAIEAKLSMILTEKK